MTDYHPAMPKITLDIPADQMERVINALCKKYGYKEKVKKPDVPQLMNRPEDFENNPESRAQFAKRMIIQLIKGIVKSIEVNDAIRSANKVASDKVESELSIS